MYNMYQCFATFSKLFVCLLCRSPGGTPLLPSKDYSGCGDGIGPVLTRALKRKFEVGWVQHG